MFIVVYPITQYSKKQKELSRTEREQIKEILRGYLKSKYADWDERKLIYKNDWLEKAIKELEGKWN